MHLKSTFDVLFKVKSLQAAKQVTPQVILDVLEKINTHLIKRPENQFDFMPQSREELFYLYKWLFQEALITLSSPELIRNGELTKFLNQ